MKREKEKASFLLSERGGTDIFLKEKNID